MAILDCISRNLLTRKQDDGSHSVACERCNVWQHSRCLGIAQDDAEREDFHFICRDCKRREEEAKLPKLPPLKFKIGSSPPSATFAPHHYQGSEETNAAATAQTNSPSKPPKVEPHAPSSSTAQAVAVVPSPPERPQQHVIYGQSAPVSDSRPLSSPMKARNGFAPSSQGLPSRLPSISQATNLPSIGRGTFGGSSLHSGRPSSAHSAQSPSLPSPIQNRPSMSPTQGNHDVGPLAGFPPTGPSDGSAPWTPFGPHRAAARPDAGNNASFSSIHSGRPSFSAATPSGSRSSPPQSSHGLPFSGISPTKQSPRPMTSGSLVGAPILPPIQKLEPSPKLMGRSSPDAPIPPPVKSMTPEQEERRQRENALMFQSQPHALSNRQYSAMSSPSLNRIHPLGPSALSRNNEPQS
jgi:DNA-directed RNA polymerase